MNFGTLSGSNSFDILNAINIPTIDIYFGRFWIFGENYAFKKLKIFPSNPLLLCLKLNLYK
tara:strand:+ start:276 stop:458 length:183 start_codon:yes stop_codon:yes gene_type:complete